MFHVPSKVEVLFGNNEVFGAGPCVPFSEDVVGAISDFASRLMAYPNVSQFGDLVTFCFWCRKSNLVEQSRFYKESFHRMGRGTVFHIAPANVPVNFAFSFVLGLLAGNDNVVRISSKSFPQTELVLSCLNSCRDSIPLLSKRLMVVRYAKSVEVTSLISSMTDARVVWGGDETIREIRSINCGADSVDLFFPDRFSFCVLSADAVCDVSDVEIETLARRFYNDSYTMDQNACSSPHIVFWVGNEKNLQIAKNRFWGHIAEVCEDKYDLRDDMSMNKYERLCMDAACTTEMVGCTKHKNYLTVINLSSVNCPLNRYSGRYGYFYEIYISDMDELSSLVDSKCQTLTYYGVDPEKLLETMRLRNVKGITRIVPIGSALDFSLVWDGHDTIRALSRLCQIK